MFLRRRWAYVHGVAAAVLACHTATATTAMNELSLPHFAAASVNGDILPPLLPTTHWYAVLNTPNRDRSLSSAPPLNDTEVLAEVKRAFATWDAVLPEISFAEAENPADATILIWFSKFSPTALAHTCPTGDCLRPPRNSNLDGRAYRAIELNDRYAWYDVSSVEAILRLGIQMPDYRREHWGLQVVLEHEIHHVLGLEHFAASLDCKTAPRTPDCAQPPVTSQATDQATPLSLRCEDLAELARAYPAQAINVERCAESVEPITPTQVVAPPLSALRPSVRVVDRSGQAVAGVTVVFHSNGGGVSDAVQVTNLNGEATVGTWQVGSNAGLLLLSASIYGPGDTTNLCNEKPLTCQLWTDFRRQVVFQASVNVSGLLSSTYDGAFWTIDNCAALLGSLARSFEKYWNGVSAGAAGMISPPDACNSIQPLSTAFFDNERLSAGNPTPFYWRVELYDGPLLQGVVTGNLVGHAGMYWDGLSWQAER